MAATSVLPVARSFGAERKFTIAFVPGSIGIQADQAHSISLAAAHGFESVEPMHADLRRDGVEKHVEALNKAGLQWAAAALPVNFKSDEDSFKEGLKDLPRVADTLKAAGVTRVGTWLRPSSNDMSYTQNLKLKARRLKAMAEILADRGQRLGLEYVGTRRNWTGLRYSFVHTMAGAKDLIAETGATNIGIVLDSWHWWTSQETGEDIRTLKNDDLVSADLNDAPKGVRLEDQYDNHRELPLATGVIDLKDFLSSLVAVGYDGPIRAEPFNQSLSAMSDDVASKATSEAMHKAFALVG